eukprot:superscaffoldBa00000611_g6047
MPSHFLLEKLINHSSHHLGVGGEIEMWVDRLRTESERICVLSTAPCRELWLRPATSLPIRSLSSCARQRLEPIRIPVHFLRGSGSGNGAVVGIYWQRKAPPQKECQLQGDNSDPAPPALSVDPPSTLRPPLSPLPSDSPASVPYPVSPLRFTSQIEDLVKFGIKIPLTPSMARSQGNIRVLLVTEAVTSSVTSQPMGLRFSSEAKQEALIEYMREHVRVCVWAYGYIHMSSPCPPMANQQPFESAVSGGTAGGRGHVVEVRGHLGEATPRIPSSCPSPMTNLSETITPLVFCSLSANSTSHREPPTLRVTLDVVEESIPR